MRSKKVIKAQIKFRKVACFISKFKGTSLVVLE